MAECADEEHDYTLRIEAVEVVKEVAYAVVGRQFNTVDETCTTPYYETIYSLLDAVSPGYRNSFSETLMQKLQQLQDPSDEESMDTK